MNKPQAEPAAPSVTLPDLQHFVVGVDPTLGGAVLAEYGYGQALGPVLAEASADARELVQRTTDAAGDAVAVGPEAAELAALRTRLATARNELADAKEREADAKHVALEAAIKGRDVLAAERARRATAQDAEDLAARVVALVGAVEHGELQLALLVRRRELAAQKDLAAAAQEELAAITDIFGELQAQLARAIELNMVVHLVTARQATSQCHIDQAYEKANPRPMPVQQPAAASANTSDFQGLGRTRRGN